MSEIADSDLQKSMGTVGSDFLCREGRKGRDDRVK